MADKLLDDSFTQHLQEALARFAEAADADAFLNAEFGEANARAIRETLSAIRGLAAEAASARSRGESNAHWLGTRLSESEREGVAAALDVGGNDPVAVGTALLERALGSFFSAERAADVVTVALEDLPERSAVSECVDAFLGSPVGDSAESGFSAVVGGVTHQYLAAQGVDVSPSATAAAVDLALFTRKVGYQSAPGSTGATFTVDDAAEAVGDRVAGALARMLGEAVESGAVTLGRTIGRIVGDFFKMGPIAEDVGRQVGQMAGSALRPLVEKGVRLVTRHIVNAASKVVKDAMAWAKSTVSKGWKSIFG